MKHPHDYSRLIAMRETADTSARFGDAWDGRERRASYRHMAKRRAEDSLSAFDSRAVYREMIIHEIKNGALSPWRRKRIVRYAAKLGLSAVEAGRLLAECRAQAAAELESRKEPPRLCVRADATRQSPRTALVLLGLTIAGLISLAVFLLLG